VDRPETIPADVTHPVHDPTDNPPAHDRTPPEPNGDPEPAAVPRPPADAAPTGRTQTGRTQTDDPFDLLVEFVTLPPRIAVASWTMAMRAARSDPRGTVPGLNDAADEHRTGSADRRLIKLLPVGHQHKIGAQCREPGTSASTSATRRRATGRRRRRHGLGELDPVPDKQPCGRQVCQEQPQDTHRDEPANLRSSS
jgi:hypothetical protein